VSDRNYFYSLGIQDIHTAWQTGRRSFH